MTKISTLNPKCDYVQLQPDPRGGPARGYFRPPGLPRQAIKGAPGSLEFQAHLAELRVAVEREIAKRLLAAAQPVTPTVVSFVREPVTPIIMHRDLKALLDATPRTGEFILGCVGDHLSKVIRLRLAKIGHSNSGFVLHGLRRNAGMMFAEAGCSVQDIMNFLGHKTPAMALYYIREVNKLVMLGDAMDAVEQREDAKRRVPKKRRALKRSAA